MSTNTQLHHIDAELALVETIHKTLDRKPRVIELRADGLTDGEIIQHLAGFHRAVQLFREIGKGVVRT